MTREWKPGDRIEVLYECDSVGDDGVPLWRIPEFQVCCSFTKKVLANARIVERPISVGDRVREASCGRVGVIIAIDNGMAWVRTPALPYDDVYSLSILTRI